VERLHCLERFHRLERLEVPPKVVKFREESTTFEVLGMDRVIVWGD
jgi:hypothetical protein